MFALKKLLSASLQPWPLLLAILMVGLVLVCFSKKQRMGKAIIAASLAILALLSIEPVAWTLARPLETIYPSLLAEATQASATLPDGSPAPRWVVVLGGGHRDDRALAPSHQLSAPSLLRLAEGIRLQRLLPGSKLVLSGGGDGGGISEAEIMGAAGASLGVPLDRMVLESQSQDTIDEVRALRAMVGQERFALVTTATHMPRSMAMFKMAGMNPIPAPTDYLAPAQPKGLYYLLGWIPHAGAGQTIERTLHEYLGLFWAKLLGQAM
jgi:uncharacterized SAM-binding protein YcdF (DUF218 family)